MKRALLKYGTLLALAAIAAASVLGNWYEGDSEPEHVVEGGDAELGRELLYQWACGSCHVIPGVADATGTVGPPLTHWSSRQYIAGHLWNEPENLIAWIVDPNEIEPGTGMPDMGVPPEAARHMAAYLYTIGDANPLGPPHPFPLEWLEAFGKVHHTGPNE